MPALVGDGGVHGSAHSRTTCAAEPGAAAPDEQSSRARERGVGPPGCAAASTSAPARSSSSARAGVRNSRWWSGVQPRLERSHETRGWTPLVHVSAVREQCRHVGRAAVSRRVGQRRVAGEHLRAREDGGVTVKLRSGSLCVRKLAHVSVALEATPH